MNPLFISIKKYWIQVPPMLRKFCIKALVLILIWKLSYHLYIKPNRIIDKPLTNITTQSTVVFLGLFYDSNQLSWKGSHPLNKTGFYSASIYYKGKRSLGIADACNALELFILYAGFIICLPSTFVRMASFIFAGIIGIFILNIFRCSAMFWFNLNNKEWFEFAHHYVFKIIVYAAIFGGWVWYCRKINFND